ncbi:family 43 glycosylhydrolase [Microbacterium sp. B2969]|uniref:Family 43 glycosylhydrolase n=1 Tax=Microbacterium alkaliflavum TaxID=3248839 RepID=A0ABW7QDK5_9MICO
MATIALVAALMVPAIAAPSAVAAETSVTVGYKAVTTQRGTPNLTYYSCPAGSKWDVYSTNTWAPAGCWFEIVFSGHTAELYGTTRSGHGTGNVFIDDVKVGTINYGTATNSTVRRLFSYGGMTDGPHTLRLEVAGNGVDHSSGLFKSGVPDTTDALDWLYGAVKDKAAADYTTGSWPAFAAALATSKQLVDAKSGTAAEREAARAALQSASDALVMVRGLRDIIEGYASRVPADFTLDSWTSFAGALAAAGDVAADPNAAKAAVVAAKNALQDAASALVTTSEGTFQPISNNTFWKDTDGNPIYSQGGGIFRFGDTYYWYGVRYTGAALYQANPTRLFNNDVTFVSIPVYSSKDLVNWRFENEVATAKTPLHIPASKGVGFAQMTTLADASWLGRIGVAYNENTGKYVLVIQMAQDKFPDPDGQAGVLLLQGDSPTDDFEFGNVQKRIVNSPTDATGDQTVFSDDDGNDYLIFSNSSGRARAFVSKLAESDSLSIEPAVQIGYNPQGREGNAMFEFEDRYYMAASALHGWNTSPNYVIQSQTDQIQGEYSGEFVLPGTEMDYSHVTQTGFFVTVKGTKKETVLYAGDRWADFAWNGLGYNQWVPIDKDGDGLRFHSVSDWEFNAVTGEWRVGAKNNYILNPEFAADRIIVPQLTGWTNRIDADSASQAFITNVTPGSPGTRFGLKLGATTAFSGGVSQTVDVPDGVYRFALTSNTTGGFEYARAVVTGAGGERSVLDLNRTTAGWRSSELTDIPISGGTATVTFEARGSGGQSVTLDGLSLVRQTVDKGALHAAVAAAASRALGDYSARTWPRFAAALATAQAADGSATATQSAVDAAAAGLTDAADALEPAVTGVTLALPKSLYAVGEQVGSVTVTARFADGSSGLLPADAFSLTGFTSSAPGSITVTATVAAERLATGAPVQQATATATVATAWTATAVFLENAQVVFEGTLWKASWWTKSQKPGDPYGPWQQLITAPDGTAVWTKSRIFTAGEVVVHEGRLYTAKWWTRNQAPGDPNGPWQPRG